MQAVQLYSIPVGTTFPIPGPVHAFRFLQGGEGASWRIGEHGPFIAGHGRGSYRFLRPGKSLEVEASSGSLATVVEVLTGPEIEFTPAVGADDLPLDVDGAVLVGTSGGNPLAVSFPTTPTIAREGWTTIAGALAATLVNGGTELYDGDLSAYDVVEFYMAITDYTGTPANLYVTCGVHHKAGFYAGLGAQVQGGTIAAPTFSGGVGSEARIELDPTKSATFTNNNSSGRSSYFSSFPLRPRARTVFGYALTLAASTAKADWSVRGRRTF